MPASSEASPARFRLLVLGSGSVIAHAVWQAGVPVKKKAAFVRISKYFVQRCSKSTLTCSDSVMVITLDFESNNLGSSPGWSFFLNLLLLSFSFSFSFFFSKKKVASHVARCPLGRSAGRTSNKVAVVRGARNGRHPRNTAEGGLESPRVLGGPWTRSDTSSEITKKKITSLARRVPLPLSKETSNSAKRWLQRVW